MPSKRNPKKMERRPFVRGKKDWQPPPAEPTPVPKGPKPTILRKHQTALPIDATVARIQPGRRLLIPDKGDLEPEAMAAAWKEAGGEVSRLGRFWEPDGRFLEENVCVYGNDIFCQVLAEKLNLKLVSPKDELLAWVPQRLVGRVLSLSHLSLVRELKFPCFVKSVQPKLFASAVYDSVEALRIKTKGLEPSTALLVSEVVEFKAEARAFIYDRKVLDCALYEGSGELEQAKEFAEEVAQLEDTPFGYVVDVGLVGDRWVIVEFNAAWASGLNGCDADKVLVAVAAATRARSADSIE